MSLTERIAKGYRELAMSATDVEGVALHEGDEITVRARVLHEGVLRSKNIMAVPIDKDGNSDNTAHVFTVPGHFVKKLPEMQ